MAPANITSIAPTGITRGAGDVAVNNPAHDGLFPADALLELLSFMPHKEVLNRRWSGCKFSMAVVYKIANCTSSEKRRNCSSAVRHASCFIHLVYTLAPSALSCVGL